MVWVILAVVAILLVLLVKDGNEKSEEFEKKNNVSIHNLLVSGTYVSGHPSLDDPLQQTKIHLDGNDVKIFVGFTEKAIIPKSSITNVTMEDSSTIQNRVGIKRLLLIGVFAFAWKKKQKSESAYLVIEWNSGAFKNETIFEFEGDGSIKKANTLRNRFIDYLSNDTTVVEAPKTEKDITEDDIYIDLIKKSRKVEAVNFYIHNNKASLSEAQKYIEELQDSLSK